VIESADLRLVELELREVVLLLEKDIADALHGGGPIFQTGGAQPLLSGLGARSRSID
jgi:hypothetical protein